MYDGVTDLLDSGVRSHLLLRIRCLCVEGGLIGLEVKADSGWCARFRSFWHIDKFHKLLGSSFEIILRAIGLYSSHQIVGMIFFNQFVQSF